MPKTLTKPYADILAEAPSMMLLGFLFLVNFSIAGSYILFSLLLFLLIVETIRNRILPPAPDFFKYFLLYILFSIVSTVFSLNVRESLDDNREFLIFLLFPICIWAIKSRKHLQYSLYVVLGSAVLSSLIGVVITIREGVSLDHRLKGLTSHWMTYSGLLMFSFVFFFIYLFYEKNRKKQIIIGFALAPVLVSIFLSLTRSAWVGTFIALAAFLVYFKPKILYFALPALAILVVALPGSVRHRLLSTVDLRNETNRDRIHMAQTGWNIFKEYPLTGAGPNQIKHIYDRYKPTEAVLSNPHLHNNLIQILAERGVFTFLALIAVFIAIPVSLAKKIKSPPGGVKWAPTGALFVFIAFFFAGLFEYNFGDTEIRFLLFYFLSIPYLTVFRSEADPSGQEPAHGLQE